MMIADVHFRKLSSNRSNELDVHPEKMRLFKAKCWQEVKRSRQAHLTTSAFQAIREYGNSTWSRNIQTKEVRGIGLAQSLFHIFCKMGWKNPNELWPTRQTIISVRWWVMGYGDAGTLVRVCLSSAVDARIGTVMATARSASSVPREVEGVVLVSPPCRGINGRHFFLIGAALSETLCS